MTPNTSPAPKRRLRGFQADLEGIAMEYLTKLPATIPTDKVLVHNHVYPVARRPGVRGSRCWFQQPDKRLVLCDCGWAPELGEHFRIRAVDATARKGIPTTP